MAATARRRYTRGLPDSGQTMDLLERATLLQYHRHRIAEYGGDAVQALGWRHADSQRLRFEAIAAAADFSHGSVLDVCCGTGDLLPFLRGRFQDFDYLGIDQMPEFIATARQRHGDVPRAQFEIGSCFRMDLPLADHVVASGALGYRSADPGFVFDAIRRLHAAARHTLVFNVLDAAHFTHDHPLLVGRDVAEVEAFCRSLPGEVEVVRGYAVDDATVVLRRT